MTHDSTSRLSTPLPVPQREQLVACLTDSCQALQQRAQRRGRPATLSALHLCLGIVVCGLRGFGAQLKLWRLLCLEPVGPFLPVQVSGWMHQQVASWEDHSLAPFACRVLALDESTLDAVGRWLPQLRRLVQGDPQLLAGRISALFDNRLQQWVRVDVLAEATANCKQHAREMLSELQAGGVAAV
jgi:hypothetical protein